MKVGSIGSIIKKVLLFTLGAVVVSATASHLYWKYSGSGEWELLHVKDGVTVHTLKASGETHLQFKMQGTFTGSLGAIMKVMRDPEACDEIGCFDSKIIKTQDYPRYQYYTFKYAYGSPFDDRQYVVRSEFKQDPITKEIYTDFKAAVDLLPEDDCCVRVTHMHNIWEFKPLGGNQVEVQFTLNEKPNGWVPYFLFNQIHTSTVHQNVEWLQEILDLDKYKNAVVDYVEEYEPVTTAVSTSE
ncbi:hypothetical protein EAG18_21915 [Pseudoalteromonas sp. J010]|uniref:hypothetical protein n=1 Tax=Pseudoalteromonas sp. J010 TaxID=998465 RepID=UPI000F65134A|nr:hypothetical protein [Pseudoalteromonas sp. J010]RRS06510.1 hypothetical protein EAG18_21915 [Pseudoalteromonas sp. J010]